MLLMSREETVTSFHTVDCWPSHLSEVIHELSIQKIPQGHVRAESREAHLSGLREDTVGPFRAGSLGRGWAGPVESPVGLSRALGRLRAQNRRIKEGREGVRD